MLRLLSAALVIFLVLACTPKPRMQVEGGATNSYSSGRILFSQPF